MSMPRDSESRPVGPPSERSVTARVGCLGYPDLAPSVASAMDAVPSGRECRDDVPIVSTGSASLGSFRLAEGRAEQVQSCLTDASTVAAPLESGVA